VSYESRLVPGICDPARVGREVPRISWRPALEQRMPGPSA